MSESVKAMDPHENSEGFTVDRVGRPTRRPENLRELAEYFGDLTEAVENPDIILGGVKDQYVKGVEAIWRFAYAAQELMAEDLGASMWDRELALMALAERISPTK